MRFSNFFKKFGNSISPGDQRAVFQTGNLQRPTGNPNETDEERHSCADSEAAARVLRCRFFDFMPLFVPPVYRLDTEVTLGHTLKTPIRWKQRLASYRPQPHYRLSIKLRPPHLFDDVVSTDNPSQWKSIASAKTSKQYRPPERFHRRGSTGDYAHHRPCTLRVLPLCDRLERFVQRISETDIRDRPKDIRDDP